ncbi:nicotinate-nucleotide adenylyltransferase [Bacillus sp. DTU_2020_1000418_1_SI_GHA_SEK_038]|uniref:nicotinate-nucleotide adenylyltransferase n=1 Tax=Bacillus sp. DTU_2020_1000418_1_SI_GHA_SEK_038 TaxID=3077585 RepID=UPI0028E1BB55|nr:nicotinate-nucleotide adenylyltransferase [Bacillus sp. DTU_2020_1000418_1_SI_GHA_SEK_038]WNS74370.1 nicotinate-nucleotide adenylyltransferase [Bacillus sp. DTU_2020_1000418_1_SI_GHA_SEK_038]
MKRIGILGGTFDPPHLGHLIIANEVLNTFELDEIWFMPNQEPPHKTKTNAIKTGDRENLLKLAISGHPNFKIERLELERLGPSYTYETMKVLTEKHPDKQFYFIIGADMVEYLPKWRNIDELVKIVQFIGVNRPSYSNKSNYPILYAEVPDIEISSSQIRTRLLENKTIRYLVPDSVMNYIKENQLYGS